MVEFDLLYILKIFHGPMNTGFCNFNSLIAGEVNK